MVTQGSWRCARVAAILGALGRRSGLGNNRPATRSRSSMRRRRLLHLAATAPFASALGGTLLAADRAVAASARRARVRPGDGGWPSESEWNALRQQVGDAFMPVHSPLDLCRAAPASAQCLAIWKAFKNPYAIGDNVALTQTLGWVDAWTSQPSGYAVAARSASDVAAAVNFAREHNLRLVVKGGGHSYQGTSNAPDSLLVWTRRMNEIALHEAFVPAGLRRAAAPARAVSVGAGAIWAQVYDAVTTQAGGYVQGGGCMTVGVAGLVQSGGFGSFSKAFGLAAAQPAGGRGGDRRRRGAHRQRVHAIRTCSGASRAAAAAASASSRVSRCACTRCPRPSAPST